jgi:hypothetical protein
MVSLGAGVYVASPACSVSRHVPGLPRHIIRPVTDARLLWEFASRSKKPITCYFSPGLKLSCYTLRNFARSYTIIFMKTIFLLLTISLTAFGQEKHAASGSIRVYDIGSPATNGRIIGQLSQDFKTLYIPKGSTLKVVYEGETAQKPTAQVTRVNIETLRQIGAVGIPPGLKDHFQVTVKACKPTTHAIEVQLDISVDGTVTKHTQLAFVTNYGTNDGSEGEQRGAVLTFEIADISRAHVMGTPKVTELKAVE